MMKILKGVCIGSGYFSQFHFEAWQRMDNVKIVAVCDFSLEKAKLSADKYSLGNSYTHVEEMLKTERPDFIDIITPPESHFELCKLAVKYKVHVICQKPFGGSLETAEAIVNLFKDGAVRLMVHENFRFQPWHREIKKLINTGIIGDKIHTINFRLRTGDGWAEDAYLDRQPYFRTMSKLLMYETGVHFIDTFRFLGGEVESVYARLRNLNKNIAGEDLAWVHFDFSSGAFGMLDANRFNENTAEDPRLTFGVMLVEGNKGTIRLHSDGSISLQLLGAKEEKYVYAYSKNNFSGDCVFETQRHFVSGIINKQEFETEGAEYLKNLRIQDAVYASSEKNKVIKI
ncbi:Gfo/Idh/MocA family protein [Flavicella sediminum]|uniref:Gfo/Idh/MocA family protein n=1 Tax=Flavicella sediminum TaxID=2585141 RepID=UPI001AA0A5C2|nr:Gfo/Idh/MocA family oxidoreductase [Flavicella sediminum]